MEILKVQIWTKLDIQTKNNVLTMFAGKYVKLLTYYAIHTMTF